MEFSVLIVLASLVKKLVDFVKYALNADINALVTQVSAWVAGVVVAYIAAHSDFSNTVMVNGVSLATLNNWSIALVGVNLASFAGVGWDLLKSIDNTNSAVVPDMLGSITQSTPADPA